MKDRTDRNEHEVESGLPYPLVKTSRKYDPCSIAHFDLAANKTRKTTGDVPTTLVLGESVVLGKSILNLREWLAIAFRLLKDQMRKRKLAENQIQEGNRKLASIFEGICQAMNAILAAKDPYTAKHQGRVAKLATAIALEVGLSFDEVEGIRIAGLLHDIGKITIPAEILSKSGKLSDHEFALVREHPQVGYSILQAIEFPWQISKIVLQHHERLNGSGYPAHLKTNNILFGAKILSVADVIEAVSFRRPYREARGAADALHHIQECQNVLYDKSVVEAALHQFYRAAFSFQ